MVRSEVLSSREPVPRYRMLIRPYARPAPGGHRAFYWLTRGDGTGIDRVIDRGEGLRARMRIERFLRRLVEHEIGAEARLAAQALYGGWEQRP